MKKCEKCQIFKELGRFYTSTVLLDGHMNICKNCVDLNKRKYSSVNTGISKFCGICKKEKNTEDFPKNSQTRCGINFSCKECHNGAHKRLRAKNTYVSLEQGVKECSTCRRVLEKSNFHKRSDSSSGLASLCKECDNKERAILKREVYEAYGGCFCIWCKEIDFGCLCLDHVNNDGRYERKKVSGSLFFLKLKKLNFPDKNRYQVLCFNCNWAKTYNNGVLPEWRKNINCKFTVEEAEDALCLGI